MTTVSVTEREVSQDREVLLDLLLQMYLIRTFEDKVYELLALGRITGASHLYAGQEAVAVGAMAALEPHDLITSTHRGHGHSLAHGWTRARNAAERQLHLNRMMAELCGKESGYSRGRGGSMHIADVSRGHLGATGIVGGNIPVATGAALAQKLQGTGAVVVCFFPPASSPQPPTPVLHPPLSGIRQTIARRMVESHAIPTVTLHATADGAELVALRERLRGLGTEPVPGYTDLLLKICAVALLRHPQLNATLDEEGLQHHDAVHIALAVETGRGLLVPVLRDVHILGLTAIAARRKALVEAARAGSLQPADMQGGTFTLTNLGQYAVEGFTPLLNPPQVAILGVGQMAERPWVADGQLVVRPVLPLSLTFDHRAVDGAPAAAFLDEVRLLIEEPTRLIL